ncbi:hypothetical protein E2C01_059554 [Portunus trituberculatus]|uniref:Uncharacterized protein n=1 Tax=Portunus trituberculatus TaxID=210409 RepID=A0A5B7H6D9_PORTR|nr:hypothetical protein [Portunus trituberculatus]
MRRRGGGGGGGGVGGSVPPAAARRQTKVVRQRLYFNWFCFLPILSMASSVGTLFIIHAIHTRWLPKVVSAPFILRLAATGRAPRRLVRLNMRPLAAGNEMRWPSPPPVIGPEVRRGAGPHHHLPIPPEGQVLYRPRLHHTAMPARVTT